MPREDHFLISAGEVEDAVKAFVEEWYGIKEEDITFVDAIVTDGEFKAMEVVFLDHTRRL